MGRESNTTPMAINIVGNLSMDCRKGSEPTIGKMAHTIEVILSKVLEMDMESGTTLRENNNIKGTTCSIENMDMASMTGPMGMSTRAISSKIKGLVKAISFSMIALYTVASGSMERNATSKTITITRPTPKVSTQLPANTTFPTKIKIKVP